MQLSQRTKENLPVIVALSLPMFFVLGTAIVLWLPNITFETVFDPLYATCSSTQAAKYKEPRYGCEEYFFQRYRFQDNHVVVLPIPPAQDVDQDGIPDANEPFRVTFYRHDIRENLNIPVLDGELMRLQVYAGAIAPDGTEIIRQDRDGDFFLFPFGGSRDSHKIVIRRGKQSKVLPDGVYGINYASNGFSQRLIGWTPVTR